MFNIIKDIYSVIKSLKASSLKKDPPIITKWKLVDKFKETEAKDLYKVSYIDKRYQVRFYDDMESNDVVIVSCDIGTGMRDSYTSIVLINSKTKHIVGELKELNLDNESCAFIIYSLVKLIGPKCMVVMSGPINTSIYAKLLSTDISPKLYYQYGGNNDKQHSFGIWLDTCRINQMQDIITKYINKYPERLSTQLLIYELNVLYNNTTNQSYDNYGGLIRAYAIGMWVYWYGTNISKFGLLRYPDL